MNYLGIDYGTKRMGLSIGDDAIKLAVPIEAIRVSTLKNAAQRIGEIVDSRKIHKIIIGYPLNMDDTIGAKAKEVDHFVKLLMKYVAIPIEPLDERLTSENVGDMRRRSSKNRQNLRKKGTIDSAAAALILQDYFDSQSINIFH
jgi:putative Holliday junction resolvase